MREFCYGEKGSAVVVLFATTIFVSAVLLFFAQSMVALMLLPLVPMISSSLMPTAFVGYA